MNCAQVTHTLDVVYAGEPYVVWNGCKYRLLRTRPGHYAEQVIALRVRMYRVASLPTAGERSSVDGCWAVSLPTNNVYIYVVVHDTKYSLEPMVFEATVAQELLHCRGQVTIQQANPAPDYQPSLPRNYGRRGKLLLLAAPI